MIAVRFRFISTPEWEGIAVAPNKKELFWTIDEHGDPYDVEIITLSTASACWKYEGEEVNEFSCGEELERDEDLKWRDPNWPPQEELYK